VDPQSEASGQEDEVIRLTPPRQALHILPFMYLLFTLMTAHYLYWYGPTAAIFRYGVVVAALGLAVHFARMLPNLTNRYEMRKRESASAQTPTVRGLGRNRWPVAR
jgi:hypothetical protein